MRDVGLIVRWPLWNCGARISQGVDVINSAVFNGGFLTGGTFFDYREVTPESDPELFAWRVSVQKNTFGGETLLTAFLVCFGQKHHNSRFLTSIYGLFWPFYACY